MNPKPLRIATRSSALALWQAEHVAACLQARAPQRPVALVTLTTQGDRNLQDSLALIGGKGLFVKELEVALAEGRADLAVHSMKDVPVEMPEGFVIAAVLQREDPRDAFVSPAGRPSRRCLRARGSAAPVCAARASCCTGDRT